MYSCLLLAIASSTAATSPDAGYTSECTPNPAQRSRGGALSWPLVPARCVCAPVHSSRAEEPASSERYPPSGSSAPSAFFAMYAVRRPHVRVLQQNIAQRQHTTLSLSLRAASRPSSRLAATLPFNEADSVRKSEEQDPLRF